jgi:hypothetical protein
LLARVSFRNKQGFGGDKKIHEAILNRHTNRNAFESRLVPIEARNVIDLTMRKAGALTSWIDEASERKQLAEIIMTADQFQFENTAFLRELAAWVRPTQTSATDGIPSKAIGISGVASYVAPFLIRTFDMGAGKAARDMELMQCSPAVVIVSTPFDRDYDWLTCGEGLGFMLLAAEQLGLKASYLNQPCEVSELRFRLSLFDTVKGNPQLILRFGYAATVAPSPRRPLAQVVRERRKSIA